jgi:hypothetical protein
MTPAMSISIVSIGLRHLHVDSSKRFVSSEIEQIDLSSLARQNELEIRCSIQLSYGGPHVVVKKP